jgi:hypothetical protein
LKEIGQTNVSGVSAYLFLGSNGTLNSTINLGGLPTVPTTSIGIQGNPSNDSDSRPLAELVPQLTSLASLAPLATILVCDPQMNVTGGIVSLENGKTLTPIKSGTSGKHSA